MATIFGAAAGQTLASATQPTGLHVTAATETGAQTVMSVPQAARPVEGAVGESAHDHGHCQVCDHLAVEREELLAEAELADHLIVLQRQREQPWIERWRQETGKHDTLPDYGEIIRWITEKADAAEAKLAATPTDADVVPAPTSPRRVDLYPQGAAKGRITAHLPTDADVEAVLETIARGTVQQGESRVLLERGPLMALAARTLAALRARREA